jgi:hypothetical protein
MSALVQLASEEEEGLDPHSAICEFYVNILC